MGGSGNEENERSEFDAIDWVESAKFGAGAWIAGYVVILVSMEVADMFEALGQELSKTDVVSYVLFSGNLGTFKSAQGNPSLVYASTWMGSPQDIAGFATLALQFLVPVVMLLLAGAKVAGEYKDHDRKTAVLAGASIAGGYAAAIVISTVVFSAPEGVSYTTFGIVVAGVLYPGVFGSIGAVVRRGPSLSPTGGVKYGVGAFLLGLFAWYLLAETSGGEPVSNHFEFGMANEILQFVMVYAHQHGILQTVNVVGLGGEYSFGWLTVAIPVAAGYLVVKREAQPATELEALFDGTTIARGYALTVTVLAIAYLGAIYTEVEIREVRQLANIAIELLPLVLFAGIVWPFVCGAIGGVIALFLD